jgi:hypothetical protein
MHRSEQIVHVREPRRRRARNAVAVRADRPGTVAAPTGRTYGGSMTEEEVDASEPDIMDIYDVVTDLALVCRVCGSLVASSGAYPRAHWDWHEASNGA